MIEQPIYLRLGSYNAALLMGPQQPKELIGEWQDRQDRVRRAILNLREPDFLTLVELANHEATASQLVDIKNQMDELDYAGEISDGFRDDGLRVSAWVKRDLCINMSKLVLSGLGELPQVETRYAITTAVHHDSTRNKNRAIANHAIRGALDEQMIRMIESGDLKAQFLGGDFNNTYVGDALQTKLYHSLNLFTRHIPAILPRFSFYSNKKFMQHVSDGVRVCDMPNDVTMGILTGGDNGFIDAAGPGQSAPTLFKGPVVIRSDHILGRVANGMQLDFGGYEVHELLAGDHAGISAGAFITRLALAATA